MGMLLAIQNVRYINRQKGTTIRSAKQIIHRNWRTGPANDNECRVYKKSIHFEIGCENKKVYKISVSNEVNSDEKVNIGMK